MVTPQKSPALDDLLEHAPCGFLRFDDGERITQANATLGGMLGYQPGELAGMKMQAILTRDAQIIFQTEILPALRLHGKADEIYLSLQLKSGEILPGLSNFVSRPSDGGMVHDCVFLPVKQRFEHEDTLRRASRKAERVTRRLRAREEQFRATFEQSAVGIGHVCSKTGRFLRVNAKLCEMIGYSAAELAEMMPADLTFPDDYDADDKELARMLRGEIPFYEAEKRYLHKDGKLIWVHLNASLLRYGDGRPRRTIAIVQDINARKLAEETINRQIRELDNFYETVPTGLFQFDADLRFLRVNAWTAAFNGRPIEAHIGRTIGEVVESHHSGQVEGILRQVLETGVPACDIEVPGTSPTGAEARVWLASYYPMLDKGGHIVGVHGVCIDITERKQAEQALRDSQQFTRSVLDNLFAFVGVLAPDGTLIQVNRAPLEAAGISASKVIGKKFWDCIWWSHSEGVQTQLRTWCAQVLRGDMIRCDVQVLMAGGKRVWIDFQLAPLRDATGRITHLIPSAMDITARHETELALRVSEEFNRTVLENSPDCVEVLDAEGRLKFINQNGLCLMEIDDINDLHGMPWAQLWPESQRAPVQKAVEQGLRGEVSRFTTPRLTTKGILRWWDVIVAPVASASDKDGVTSLISVSRDITAQKLAEETLREQGQRLRSLLENSPLSVLEWDSNFVITRWAGEAEATYGWSAAEVIGRPISELDLIFQADQDAVENVITRLTDGVTRHFTHNLRLCTRDRKVIHCIWHHSVLVDEFGEIVSVLTLGRDVTAQKEAEIQLLQRTKELSESEVRRRLATEVSAVGIWEWNVLTDVMHWDTQIFRIYGIAPTPDGFVHYSTWSGALLPEDLEESERILLDAISRGEESRCEFRILRRDDGECRHIEAVETVRTNARGETEWVVGTNLDITERKLSREALVEAKDRAEAASRAKDHFLAALSHELRTPLNPVLMMATALASDPSLPPEAREQLDMMRRNIELEARLIDDLLDLTHITHGKFSIEQSVADVHDLLAYTDEIIRSDSLGKHLRISLNFDAVQHHTLADPARLQQVFWNLLRNAVKFTPDGGAIFVNTHNDAEGKIIISVTDSGIGIRAEVLPQIFDAFEQGDSAAEHRYGGLGLGLAISSAIVTAHGGEIKAESQGPGHGSMFTVILRTVPAPLEASKRDLALPQPAHVLRLLVVEDHDATRTVLDRLLTHSGHRVTTVSTVDEALTKFRTMRFDAVISDLGLPDGSGLDLVEEIQRIRPVPAIALSGYGMEGDVKRTQEAGFFAHLVKPVKMDQLKQLLTQIPAQTESRDIA